MATFLRAQLMVTLFALTTLSGVVAGEKNMRTFDSKKSEQENIAQSTGSECIRQVDDSWKTTKPRIKKNTECAVMALHVFAVGVVVFGTYALNQICPS